MTLGDASGGASLMVQSLGSFAVLALARQTDPVRRARTRATDAALAALQDNPDFARANLARMAYLLSEVRFEGITHHALLAAVQQAEGANIAPPLADFLFRQMPFDGDDPSMLALTRIVLEAATRACASDAAFREDMLDLMLMTLVRQHKLQDHFLSAMDAKLDRLIADMERHVRELALKEGLIIGLARRIAEDVADFDTALRELERALTLAAQMRDQAALPSNTGDQVTEVLRRLSELNDQNRLDDGADLIADELARIDAQKARLYDAAIDQDILRRNARSAARWLVERLKAENPPDPFEALRALQDDWYVRGRDGGLNFEAEVAIHLAHASRAHATTLDPRGTALNNLGNTLVTLGQREPGTARLEDAVAAYRAALEERTRDRVPLDWAMTQTNLGSALQTLGQREHGTARLEDAVTSYRAPLEEYTRDRVPLYWATAQYLGTALQILGLREPGTARLEDAVTAYRSALQEWTRDRAPLYWAGAQMNLGNALGTLGHRESSTARLEEAVTAYRAALEERTRDRVPLDWAMAQMNLGVALWTLGEREPGTARLQEAVTAYRAALQEFTRDRVPLDWAMAQVNLGIALKALGEREPGTARLEDAVTAYRAALEERTRDRVPLDWANTVGAMGVATLLLAERKEDAALARDGLRMLRQGEAGLREGGHGPWAETYTRQIPAAEALVARLSGTSGGSA
jgi:tetratricopeptide (TPR) repeat protein